MNAQAWVDARAVRAGECWLWKDIGRAGYGRIQGYAHRIVYEMTNGPVPVGLELDHKCGNRACTNPDHLEPITHRENIQRGWDRKYQGLCKRGHPKTDANVARRKNGAIAWCRICHRDAEAKRRNRHQNPVAK